MGRLIALLSLVIAVIGLVVAIATYVFPDAPQRVLGAGNQTVLGQLFARSLLGLQRSYVEEITGPALSVGRDANPESGERHVWDVIEPSRHFYEVDGCRIEIVYEDERVTSYGLHVTPECSFDWNKVLPGYDDLPAPNRMVVRDAYRMNLRLDRSYGCIQACGTAYPFEVVGFRGPVGSLSLSGWEAGLLLVANDHDSSEDMGEQISQFYERLRDDGQRVGRNFPPFCDYDVDGAVQQELADLPITYVQISTAESAYPAEELDAQYCAHVEPLP